MDRCSSCMKEYNGEFDVCPHCGFVKGTPPKEVYHLYPGMELGGRYTIGTVLGFGGFGITYRAWDSVLSTVVAIKEYYPSGVVNRVPGEKRVIVYTGNREKEYHSGLSRFLDEAKNMAKFNTHPNVVNVYDFFEENNTAYIVMEFLDGISLKQYIASEGGKISLETSLDIITHIADALEEIHKIGIVHRDISTDNIFICFGGKVKLIDFGAARFSKGEEDKTLSIILKPGYAPPEQYRSKSKQGPWTDIYALGATLYRCVTGQMPEESINRVVEDNLIRPREIDENIPEHIEKTILMSMAINYELRFQNMGQFKEALRKERKVLEVKEEVKKRKSKRILSVSISAAILVIIGVVVFGSILNVRKQEVLAKATVVVWLPVDEPINEATTVAGTPAVELTADEKAAKLAKKQDVLKSMLTEYEKNNSQITVKVVNVLKSEYKAKLLAAVGTAEMPTLFDSSYLSADELDIATSLTSLFDTLKVDDYYFLDKYEEYFPSQKQLPLGFSIPVVYTNTQVNTDQDITVDDEVAIIDAQVLLASKNVTISKFLNKETGSMVEDISNYSKVQQNLPGIYTVKESSGKKLLGTFTDIWSVSESASANEKAAGIRMLNYFLSENAQDVLFIQNSGTLSDSLPLNKTILSTFISVNGELSFIDDAIKKTDFEPEKVLTDLEYYNQLKSLLK